MLSTLSPIPTIPLKIIDKIHSILPLCPLCNKEIIQIETITRTPCNDEPKIEFTCACLKTKDLPNSSIPIKEYIRLLNQRKMNSIPTCFKHKDKNGMYYCMTCHLYMCQSCYDYHNIFERSHITQYAQEINNIMCEQHINANCNFFCTECNAYICEICKDSSHSNHNVKTFHDIWEHIYNELDFKSAEELNVRWEKQKIRIHLYFKEQIKLIDLRISRLEHIRNQFNDMYRTISYENDIYLQFYKIIFNNFLCSKLSPKLSIMHNMTKFIYSFDSLLQDSIIINLNAKNENIGNSIIEYDKCFLESLNKLKIIKDKNNNFEEGEFLPPINYSNFQQKMINYQVYPEIKPQNQKISQFNKLSTYKENSYNSVGSMKLLGNKREKSTSDTSSVINDYLTNEINSIHSEQASTKNLIFPSIPPSIPVSAVTIQNSGENIYSNVCSNRNYETMGISKKKIEINVPKGQNVKMRYSQCVRAIVNENLVSKAISIYKVDSDYYLVTAGDNKTIRIYNLNAQKELKVLKTSPSQALYFSSSLISSNECLCSFDDNSIKILNLKTFTFNPKEFIGHTKRITEIVFFVNKKYFASSSKDRTIILWNTTLDNWKKTLKGHQKGVLSLVLSNNKLVSGGADALIKIWDLITESCVGNLYGHTGSVLCLSKIESNPYVISASNDNTVRIWDIDNQKCLSSYGEDNLNITTVKWISKDIIAGGSTTGGLYLFTWNDDFDCYEIKEMAHKKDIVRVLSYENGKYIVSSSEDKTIKFWMN